MRCIPNMIVSAPMDESELRNLMYTAMQEGSPFCIRYPRGKGVLVDWRTPFCKIEVGKGRKIKEGRDIALLTFGTVGNYAFAACKELEKIGVSAALYDMRFVKPIDKALLHDVFKSFNHVITVEDGCLMGGFGSAVAEFLVDHGYHTKLERLGIPDRMVEHGTQLELHKECGFDPKGIFKSAMKILEIEIT